ncbi:MAG: hypothetical protein Q4C49_11185 [Bacillota bacterium]|nr:hypothetical protein [Bacillota bacterium]
MKDSRNLSVEEWVKLYKNGISVPMTTVLYGTSMEPLIRFKKDKVTIIPVSDIQKGDIVLFEREDGAYVVHRVYSIQDNMVQTWGDNCKNKDKPMDISKVLGQVVCVEKNGKKIDLNTDAQREYGITWMHGCFKRDIHFLKQKIKYGVLYRIRDIFKR